LPSGASPKLGALVTQNGPLDRFVAFGDRSSPIVDHALGWRGGFGGFFYEGAGHGNSFLWHRYAVRWVPFPSRLAALGRG